MLAVKLILIALVGFLGIGLANMLYDRGIKNYLSRKVAHIFGGVAYLLAILLLEAPAALVLSVVVTLYLVLLRFHNPQELRGVGGTGRPHAFAELTYPIAGTISLALGWLWLGDKWLALVPVLFMAWGDSITGLVRGLVYGREVKGIWGSVAMGGVCVLIALLYHPYWIGLTGAVIATVVEKLSPIARGWVDDNSLLTLSSLVGMAVLKGI